MKQFDLINLKHSYFKGSKELFLQPDGRDMDVYGDNGTGKTTIFDSICFILFDKDSENKSPGMFGIKTTDENGKLIPGVSHEVEATFQYGATQITLKKVYKEVWTKKRGSVLEVNSGNTTDYFYDGVAMAKGEYEERINKIISERVFKLLTNPRFFSEMTKDYKERREILLDACGDISDEDILEANPKLAAFPGVLDGKTLDDRTKIILSRRTAINDEIESIPDRIDEVRRGMPDVSGANEKHLAESIEKQRTVVSEKESEVSRIRSGSEITVKQNRITAIDGELLTIKNQVEADSYKAVSAQRAVVSDLKRDSDFIMVDIRNHESTIRNNEVSINRKTSEVAQLGERFDRINAESFLAFEHHGEDSCPACKQSLPSDQVQAAHDIAKADHSKKLAEFNVNKSARLENINIQGKALKNEISILEAENANSRISIESLNNQMITARENLNAGELYLIQLSGNVQHADTDPAYIAKQAEKVAVEVEIATLRNSTHEAVEKVNEEIRAIRDVIIALEQDHAKFEQIRKAESRIEELKNQERELASEFEKTEQDLWIIAEFTKQKVSMLESKINARFKHTRFKLFEIQQNGGLKDMCEATNLQGIAYNAGLNNAGRITCGMDIINVLAERFELAPPVVIDNCEGVTRPIKTHGQQIRLNVSEKDQKLRVEMVQEKVGVAV